MSRINKAREFRRQIRANIHATKSLIRVDDLTEEELNEIIDLYPPYQIGKEYKKDELFTYQNKLYKVVQSHTSEAGWLPDELPALYTDMLPENIIPEWTQPLGGHDAYHTGDKVLFKGNIYESVIDNNTWSPSDYPQGWKEVTEVVS